MDDVDISPATDDEAAVLLERSKETCVEALQGRRALSAREAATKADADTDRLVPAGRADPRNVFLTAQQMSLSLGDG